MEQMKEMEQIRSDSPSPAVVFAEGRAADRGMGVSLRGLLQILIIALLAVVGAGSALAQQDELLLSVRKSFGYNSGSQIQGTFRAEVTGPADLAQVTFTLDDQPFATATAAPFRASFETGQYALGWHTLGASGQTAGGRTLSAKPKRYEFVSSASVTQGMARIILPLGGVLLLALLLGLGLPLLGSRGQRRAALAAGARRNYGPWGGAICPKCSRPFARHFWSLNMITGKLDRCDHCGRWSIVRAQPLDVLRKAEEAELAGSQPAPAALSPEEELKRRLDESRYTE